MKRLTSTVVPVRGLDESAAQRLFEVYNGLYEPASRESFDRHLAGQDFVVLLSDRSGALRGFSTQQIQRLSLDGRPLRAVFSGDTVIDRSYWGEQELVRGWCRFVGRVWSEDPRTKLYWFLATNGYRAYLYQPLFFREYHPRPGAEAPAFERALIAALGRRKFPEHFNPETGVVEFGGGADRLRPELARTPRARQGDPRVSFYLARNPGYARGDELVSVAEISGANMKGLARRMFEEGVRLGPIRIPAAV